MSGAGVVLIDGRACEPGAALVSVYDRGFLYGDGVFESLRTYSGVPFALEEHIERLLASARALRIAPTVHAADIVRETLEAIARVGDSPTHADCYVRLMLTRGSGRLGMAIDPRMVATRVILVEPLEPMDATMYARGVSLATVRAPPPLAATSASAAKAMRYLAAIVAQAEARESGADEALLVDPAGHVLEGATCNVFAVIDEALVTPPISSGVLPGITRRRVLELARSAGVAVVERDFSMSEALLTELFVTSSLREVMPATRVDARPVGRGAPGPITVRLHTDFRRTLPGSPAPSLVG